MSTKLQNILNEKGLTQGDLINKIKDKYGVEFTRSYVSKVCSGVITNYTVRTALMISETLGISLNQIIDTKLKKGIRLKIAKTAANQQAKKAEKKEKKNSETISDSGVVL